jgi:nucleotide-binding universal stress UspA family protein
MRDLGTILCPVDFSEATAFGLNAARSIALRFDCDLHLLHVLPAPRFSPELPVDTEEIYDRWQREAGERIRELAAELRREGARVGVELRRGSPHETIVGSAQESRADLIVMPTHSRAALDRLLYGSVTERVVRTAECPVLTVPPALESMREFSPRRVLLAAELSSDDDVVLEAAAEFARAYGSDLVVGHVFTYAHVAADGPEWWWPTLTRDQVAQAMAESTRRLELIATRAQKLRLRVSTDISQGSNPAREIVRLVEEEDADLVVAGAGGGSLIRQALLGRTAEKLLRACPCPLLTVPQPIAEESAEGNPVLVPAGA